jgi:5'-nucleotidase (lipoprotein e(P4) family)
MISHVVRFRLPQAAAGCLLASLTLTGQTTPTQYEGLNATLWMQTAVEYQGSARQAWTAARNSLPKALADKSWTASLEQKARPEAEWRDLPPAIIVDVDETVLDNSPAQARTLVDSNGRFSQTMWKAWVQEGRCKGVPGAAEFLRYAAEQGVTVFYVTNRDLDEEAATRGNLKSQGFPLQDATSALGDVLLLRAERPEWSSDKTSRRQAVGLKYRIVLLGGDDFNDFTSARISQEERAKKAADYESYWGERWIVLPNAMYGSWEDAVLDYQRTLTLNEIHARKEKRLRTEGVPQ